MAECDYLQEDKVEIKEISVFVSKDFRSLMKETGLSAEELIAALVEAYSQRQPLFAYYEFEKLEEINEELEELSDDVLNCVFSIGGIQDQESRAAVLRLLGVLLGAILFRMTRVLEFCEIGDPEAFDETTLFKAEGESLTVQIPMTEALRTLQENVGLPIDALLLALQESYFKKIPLMSKQEYELIKKTYFGWQILLFRLESQNLFLGETPEEIEIRNKKNELDEKLLKFMKWVIPLRALLRYCVPMAQQMQGRISKAELEEKST